MSSNKNFIEFSRPFIEAAKNVFETMVFTKLDAQKPGLKKNNISMGDVSAVLGLTGEVKMPDRESNYKAMLVLSWPYDTYFKVASAMLMDTFTEYNEEIADVGGEISNMIMGNAKRDLAELGYTSNMAIPSMVEGAGHTLKYPEGTTVIVIPITSAHGPFYMELCYRED
ncbi:MAG: chemotaxis protein CheX [Halobacteriovoraceae bacterium]|nr:chemotaxis protein CheX [Halobacteriovoraceae bacterium]